MKKYLPLAASVLLLAACSEKPGYEITGTVSDPDANGKYVYLVEYGKTDAVPLDSALIENGAFVLKGEQVIPALRALYVGEDQIKRVAAGENQPYTAVFTLENAKLQAVLDDKAPAVSGTPENDAFKALQDKVKGIRAPQQGLEADLKSTDEETRRAAEKQYDAIDAQAIQAVLDYVKANTDKQMAAKVFVDARYEIGEDDQNAILSQADSVFTAVPGISKMIEHLAVLKFTAVGKKFTDFEMADAKGKMHKLSEYVGNGKVVLIDFWASWCPPCRREMPNLVQAYKDYKGKGFEIVGISLDSKPEAWAKGVKDLNITWPQLSDLQGWKNGGAAIYGVNSIPHTVLVDKDGTIIAKGLHGDQLEAKLKEVLK